MISVTTEFNGRIMLFTAMDVRVLDYGEEEKRRSVPWFMNKLHYMEITKHYTKRHIKL